VQKPLRKFEFGTLTNRKNAHRAKFDFEPLITKGPRGPPKWSNALGVKFERGSRHKRPIPQIKIEFGIIKMLVCWVGWWAPKIGKSHKKPLILVVANSVL
jgi:hypothetical protein